MTQFHGGAAGGEAGWKYSRAPGFLYIPKVPSCPGTRSRRMLVIPKGTALPCLLLRVPACTSDSCSVLELSLLQAGRLPGRIPGSRASPGCDSAGITVKVIPRAAPLAGQIPLMEATAPTPPSPFPMERQLSQDLPVLGEVEELGLSLQRVPGGIFPPGCGAWIPPGCASIPVPSQTPLRREQHIPKGWKSTVP